MQGYALQPGGGGCDLTIDTIAASRMHDRKRKLAKCQGHVSRSSTSSRMRPKSPNCNDWGHASGPLKTLGSFMSFQRYRLVVEPFHLLRANCSAHHCRAAGLMASK